VNADRLRASSPPEERYDVSTVDASTTNEAKEWFAVPAESVIADRGSDAEQRRTGGEAAAPLSQFGPNELTSEPPPSSVELAQ
jgi:hypothetical protein